jgi:hypothetical protein
MRNCSKDIYELYKRDSGKYRLKEEECIVGK